MCLGIPMKIMELTGLEGVVEIHNVKRNVSFMLLDDVKVGDMVLIHAGFAIQKISEKDAEEIIKVIESLDFEFQI
ncbi:HypC/HybG/HupF family hydrogenase formation chaperone [Candidatus Dependentiae bacterium]|nr:HypC/HybG/HupF family hydrogenase formation chaperone [Candidatus Dependentiae bacterium]